MAVNPPILNLGINAEGLNNILPQVDIKTGLVDVGINNNNHNNTAIEQMTRQMGQGSQTGQPNPGNGDVHTAGDRPTVDLRAQNNGGNNGNQGINNGNNGNQGVNNGNQGAQNNGNVNNGNQGNNANNGNGNNVNLRTNNGNQGTNNNGNNGNNGNHYGNNRNQGINNGNGNNNGNNGNHYGWYKNGNNGNGNNGNHNGNVNFGQNNGQNHGQNNGTNNGVNTPPIFQPQNPTAPGKQNPVPTTTPPPVQTPPIFENPGNQKPTTNQNFPQWEPILIINTRLFDLNLRDNILRSAVNETLRQNDIYVSRDVVNRLIRDLNPNGNQNGNGSNRTTNIPNEVRQLVQSVLNQVSNTLNNSTPVNPQIIRQVASEVSNNFQPQMNLARDILIFTSHPDAKHFSNLNIQERVFLAVEMMLNHLSSETNLQQFSSKEIYNGLLLARGMITSGENTADIRNLIALRSDILQNGFSPAGLRDLGQLVKGLVVNAANAKTTINLDAAVQKFIKILLANNELGVLLAAAALGKQAERGTITMNRTLALVQVYQLIARLIMAGEAALKELALKEAVLKNAPVKSENNLSAIGLNKITDADEKSAMLRDLQNSNLHNNLKNFLEFNPSAITDRSASSFVNPDDARHAQNHFSSTHHDEIEQWINSGNHRFVKEIDLEKPIGVVVERGSDDFFPATKARIVLVRDSSPQGWHFLKSILVR